MSHHAHPPALRYGAVQALDGAADGALYSDLYGDLQGVGLSSPCTSPATRAAAVPASSIASPPSSQTRHSAVLATDATKCLQRGSRQRKRGPSSAPPTTDTGAGSGAGAGAVGGGAQGRYLAVRIQRRGAGLAQVPVPAGGHRWPGAGKPRPAIGPAWLAAVAAQGSGCRSHTLGRGHDSSKH